MNTSSNTENKFVTNLSKYKVVGFHATTELACEMIEGKGFLPDKVFPESVHNEICSTASLLKIDTQNYVEWLDMRSATFAQEATAAVNHIITGNAGGQGLRWMEAVLEQILQRGKEQQKNLAHGPYDHIQRIRQAGAVVYAVDLSELGPCLVKDKHRPLYQFYWDPSIPPPAVSEIAPSRLIERLSITQTPFKPQANIQVDPALPQLGSK